VRGVGYAEGNNTGTMVHFVFSTTYKEEEVRMASENYCGTLI
jgi:hypothetical protein